jgi:hypothetical protein
MVPGGVLDDAVGALLLESVTPLTLEVALSVEQELTARLDEADLARRRYMQVDPDNRLVADELEREWNDKLRSHREVVEVCDQKNRSDRSALSAEQPANIRQLATDFPALWNHPHTPQRERKRMARLLVEDVTLIRRAPEFTAHVRFRGGTATTLTRSTLPPAWKPRQTPTVVVAAIDRLLDQHTPGQIADILNRRGVRSGAGTRFHRTMVQRLIQGYGLKDRYTRLREAGMLTCERNESVVVTHRCGGSQRTMGSPTAPVIISA